MTPARLGREQDEAVRRQLRRLGAIDPRQLSDFEVWAGIEQCLLEAPCWGRSPGWPAGHAMGADDCRLFTPDAHEPRSAIAQTLVDLVQLGDLARREPGVARRLAAGAHPIATLRRALGGTAFLAALERFVERHGHRGPGERDWSRAGYGEDPTPVIEAVRRRVIADFTAGDDLEARLARRRADAAQAWAGLGTDLPTWRRWLYKARVRRAARIIHRHVRARERVRGDIARVMAALRAWHLALADRFVERGWLRNRAVYFRLRLPEIAPVIHGHQSAVTLAHFADGRLGGPGIGASQGYPLPRPADEALTLVPELTASRGEAGPGELRGLPLAPGSVEAPVVVVRDPDDVSHMRAGAILVAPAIDASWLPILSLAAGIVLERGGFLSQGAAIARECGLPALGLAVHATTGLRTGDRIRLDATAGRIVQLLDVVGDIAGPHERLCAAD